MLDTKQGHFGHYYIDTFGCYFLSILIGGERMYTRDSVIAIYNVLVREGFMRSDCYILEPRKIAKLLKIDTVVATNGSHFINKTRNIDPITLRPPIGEFNGLRFVTAGQPN